MNEERLSEILAKYVDVVEFLLVVPELVEALRATKHRAVALENALHGDCNSCTTDGCRLPCQCINSSGWQFDETSFVRKSGADE